MNELVRAAAVIARRDYVATVWSKSFLLFLIGPFFPLIIAAIFGVVSARVEPGAAPTPPVAVIASPSEGAAIVAARERLTAGLSRDGAPELRIVGSDGPGEAQARRLLAAPQPPEAVLVAGDRPLLLGPAERVAEVKGWLGLILDDAAKQRALVRRGEAWAPPVLATRTIEPRAVAAPVDRSATARVGQMILVVLTMILAGMLLSNMIEEKSNKVIEVLAAAVPVDAIFVGKLVAMLGMSLTGIAVWAGVALLGFEGLSATGAIPPGLTLPTPALGWPAFVALGIVYFIASYLLLGALFLGIGAQATTVREVQTMSMPITMGQLIVFSFASFAVADPTGGIAQAAAVFPWSSPFVMISRAAQDGALWPHALAVAWQALWVAIIVRVAAGRFRRSVLNVKSGGPRRRLFARSA